jgi:hypothetical protein
MALAGPIGMVLKGLLVPLRTVSPVTNSAWAMAVEKTRAGRNKDLNLMWGWWS